jgi:hypothetical protein
VSGRKRLSRLSSPAPIISYHNLTWISGATVPSPSHPFGATWLHVLRNCVSPAALALGRLFINTIVARRFDLTHLCHTAPRTSLARISEPGPASAIILGRRRLWPCPIAQLFIITRCANIWRRRPIPLLAHSGYSSKLSYFHTAYKVNSHGLSP